MIINSIKTYNLVLHITSPKLTNSDILPVRALHSSCKLVTTPDDRIVFPVKEDSPPEPVVELKIENKGDAIQLYKVKCTNNELIKIRPPVGILKPQGSATVRLMLLTKEDLPEDDRQYVAVYNHETEDANTKARMQWDMVKKEQGIKRLYVRFERE
ncbi:MSP domain-containing protein [Meloidogyne graminicola]|uniref:Major sperm protein n=2 Tax=Meloidogyne graminicola TaxID=189291 RepID=A0A8S9ZBL2_9BILA|nr:MSP domain-containing protein [Meloidogyne graminicola]